VSKACQTPPSSVSKKREQDSEILISRQNENTQIQEVKNQPNQKELISLLEQHLRPTILHSWASLYFCLIIGSLIVLSCLVSVFSFVTDFRSKYLHEVQLQNLAISECRHRFRVNRCDDPVPEVRSFCIEQEKCLMGESYLVVKNINIFSRLLVETINEFAMLLTNRALVVLAVIIFASVSGFRILSTR
jgi:hypothetical protein